MSPAGTTTLGYDFESRLVSMSGPGIAATYAYNGLDARRGKTMNGVSRSYLRGFLPLTPAPLPLGERGSRTGVSVRGYGATKYLHGGLRNAVAQSSSSQTLTATRLYDAFGNVDSSSGSWTGALGYGGPYGYQSASEGGLMLLGHRYYDPSTGRFLTRDPVKDGRNWYAYGDGNPVSRVDPDGLKWHNPVGVIVDPGFVGEVIIIGEPGPGKSPVQGILRPGWESPPQMDVDYVIVNPKGPRPARGSFVPGGWFPGYPCWPGGTYIVRPDGSIHAKPRLWHAAQWVWDFDVSGMLPEMRQNIDKARRKPAGIMGTPVPCSLNPLY